MAFVRLPHVSNIISRITRATHFYALALGISGFTLQGTFPGFPPLPVGPSSSSPRSRRKFDASIMYLFLFREAKSNRREQQHGGTPSHTEEYPRVEGVVAVVLQRVQV